MTAHEPAMAKVNQMMPLSGQPKRFSFHMEINAKTTQVSAGNTINQRLKAIIVSWGCRCLCRPGKSDRGVLDAALRQLRTSCTLSFNGTQLEFGFLPDEQALPYGVGMQPQGVTD